MCHRQWTAVPRGDGGTSSAQRRSARATSGPACRRSTFGSHATPRPRQTGRQIPIPMRTAERRNFAYRRSPIRKNRSSRRCPLRGGEPANPWGMAPRARDHASVGCARRRPCRPCPPPKVRWRGRSSHDADDWLHSEPLSRFRGWQWQDNRGALELGRARSRPSSRHGVSTRVPVGTWWVTGQSGDADGC